MPIASASERAALPSGGTKRRNRGRFFSPPPKRTLPFSLWPIGRLTRERSTESGCASNSDPASLPYVPTRSESPQRLSETLAATEGDSHHRIVEQEQVVGA
jgi:hypothetical protein